MDGPLSLSGWKRTPRKSRDPSGEVFSEGAEERKVGFCVVFVSEGSTSIIDEVGVGGGRKMRGDSMVLKGANCNACC